MYREIVEIIKQLRAVGSSNDKKAILKLNENNSEWKKFLFYVYAEVEKVYGKTKLPIIPSLNEKFDHDINELYNIMDLMADGDLSGKDADAALVDLLIGADEDFVDLAGLILKRDIKAKVGATMLNDVYGHGFINIPPYMRCEKEDALEKRIKYPCFGQTKEDGLFLNVELWTETGEAKTSVRITTRQGFEILGIDMEDMPAVNEMAQPLIEKLNINQDEKEQLKTIAYSLREFLITFENRIIETNK